MEVATIHASVASRRTVSAPLDKDAVQRFTDALSYCIRSGQMVPGQHPLEDDLTKRFGVSRGPLREGLRQLSSQGIVTLTRYRGAFIAALDRDNVRDLLDVLEPLCVLAARLAARHCDAAERKRELIAIAAELGRIDEPRGNMHDIEARRRFYELLVAIGGNSELELAIPLARTNLFRAQFDREQSKAEHKRRAGGYSKIAKAVAENDPVKATRAVKKNFEATRRTLDALPDEAFALTAG